MEPNTIPDPSPAGAGVFEARYLASLETVRDLPPRIAASYAESFTELAWKPDRSVGRVLSGTALSFGGQALLNLGRELTRIQVHIHPRSDSRELGDRTTPDRPTPVPVAGSM